MFRSLIFFVVTTVMIAAGMVCAQSCLAGEVEIVATRDYCNVEFREGPSNNPDANTQIYQGQMSAGSSMKGRDGYFICYRREANPGVCPSGMGYWVCNSNPTSEPVSYDMY